jgi:hypothetical protein
MRTEDKIAEENKRFLLQKIKEYGTTVKALDWKSVKDQEIRFLQLSALFKKSPSFR